MNLAKTIDTLYQQYGQLPGITIECQNELVAIGIKNKAAVAEVFIQGAQLTRYQRVGEKPLLFLSDDCSYKEGSALRGGIPICWPWFGDIAKNPESVQQMLPEASRTDAMTHGFVRSQQWQVDSIITPTDQLTIIELSYSVNSENPLWPYSTQLSYRIEIGERLSASLLVKNTGDQVFAFSGALHSYIAVNHIDSVSIQGFDQVPYIDALDDWQLKTQHDTIEFTAELDRIYHTSCGPAVVSDANRKVTVASTGSNSTVIWNPWIDKSQQLSQFQDAEYQRMLCIETANVMDDVIHLLPQQEHTLGVHLF
jgi:glucose-6-phosphate 1-epimerase